jgi:periplasmic protein TonB
MAQTHVHDRTPLWKSLGLHVAIVTLPLLFTTLRGPVDTLGGLEVGAGSVSVSAVRAIPMPQNEARVNPVANDSKSQAPPPEVQKPVTKPVVKVPEPDAELLPSKRPERVKPVEQPQTTQKFQPEPPDPNRVTSTAGPALSTPMMAVPGSGGVGAGPETVLGTRLGWYAKLLREKLAQKWRTNDVDMRLRTAPAAIVVFTLRADGSATNVKISKSSGNYALDNSAMRAVYEASPFPPLPPQFGRDTANIEFWFELKR